MTDKTESVVSKGEIVVEIVRARTLAEAFAKLLKGRSAPPGVKTVGDVSSKTPGQFAVFDVDFGDGETYRVKIERR